jgi:hypothetical protein
MNPKNKQLLPTVAFGLLAVLNLYRLLVGEFEHEGFRRFLAILATVSFAVLSVDGFLRYRRQ